MRQTTQLTMFNFYFVQTLKSSMVIVDFIFTCNYKNKIIEPLHSRCAVVDFSIKGKEKQEIAVEFFKRLNYILDEQRVEYDKKVIVELINKHFPDWRRVLNECQKILC